MKKKKKAEHTHSLRTVTLMIVNYKRNSHPSNKCLVFMQSWSIFLILYTRQSVSLNHENASVLYYQTLFFSYGCICRFCLGSLESGRQGNCSILSVLKSYWLFSLWTSCCPTIHLGPVSWRPTTVQPSFPHRYLKNWASWSITIVGEHAVTPHLVVRRQWQRFMILGLSSANGGMTVGLWKLLSLDGRRPPWYWPLALQGQC